ncbi:TonB-dependent receptor [Pseudoduganella sp. DS3]|uniref:TonB-dependent receptor n=1 Tax=Pseudoduganella guangdongensis TaxID=2692179 RepID=A0A6N9HMG5_9BURK|nr:TonB-dependent receptor [Pseudoduganella guangdongensis]MYN04383.1 TonB-dependent receptor [Pseudoduganella guangdongensis]
MLLTHALVLMLATDADNAMERVQVTGSRINLRQEQLAGVGPVAVIDQDAILRSGATSLETLLQQLPASAGAAGNQGNAYWTANGYGTAQVNLRGLGINRTLVLLNGRRLVVGGTGANSSVDLNMIPLALVERIEVLKDGASAVYGADALAGVVNIITRKAGEGNELALRSGATTRGDGDSHAADGTLGWRTAQGAWTAGLHFSRQESVPMASRAPCPLAANGMQLVCSGSSSTAGGRARLADGRRVNFIEGGLYEPYDVLKHGFNSNTLLNAVNPVRRLGASLFGQQALAPGHAWFNELLYVERRSEQLASPGTLGVFRPMAIAAAHPTNPTGQDLVLERRRVAEAGPRDFFQRTRTARIVSGLRGRFENGWEWSASLNWARNTGIDGSTNVINLDRVAATLDAANCGRAGAAPCGNYLGLNSLAPAVLDYLHTTIRDEGGNAQRSFQASLSGEMMQLPAGAIGFAAGVEVRREQGWRDPDPLVVARVANLNAQDRVAGKYLAREAYAELAVPVLAALRVNAAGRYSHYDLFGAQWTYKAGLDWQVAGPLKLRANRSRAFRVPTVPELFGGVMTQALTTSDPCNRWDSLPADSVVYRNCRADGVPAGYRQLGNTTLTTAGGNLALRPELAQNRSAGLVWTPSRRVTLTADYFDIRIDNAIEAVPGSTKLAICYNTPELAHVFCGAASFTRDPATGDIDFLSSQPENVAQQRISGVDLGALVDFSLADWRMSLALDATRLQRFEVTPYPGGATIAYAGKITGGRGSFAHWRSSAVLSAGKGAWSGSYGLQLIGKADDINGVAANAGASAPSVVYHNASLRYAASAALTLSLAVENLWDRKAPFIQSWIDGNTDTMTYDLLGRRWQLRLAYRF